MPHVPLSWALLEGECCTLVRWWHLSSTFFVPGAVLRNLGVISLKLHNNPMKYILSLPYFTAGETEPQTDWIPCQGCTDRNGSPRTGIQEVRWVGHQPWPLPDQIWTLKPSCCVTTVRSWALTGVGRESQSIPSCLCSEHWASVTLMCMNGFVCCEVGVFLRIPCIGLARVGACSTLLVESKSCLISSFTHTILWKCLEKSRLLASCLCKVAFPVATSLNSITLRPQIIYLTLQGGVLLGSCCPFSLSSRMNTCGADLTPERSV